MEQDDVAQRVHNHLRLAKSVRVHAQPCAAKPRASTTAKAYTQWYSGIDKPTEAASWSSSA